MSIPRGFYHHCNELCGSFEHCDLVYVYDKGSFHHHDKSAEYSIHWVVDSFEKEGITVTRVTRAIEAPRVDVDKLVEIGHNFEYGVSWLVVDISGTKHPASTAELRSGLQMHAFGSHLDEFTPWLISWKEKE